MMSAQALHRRSGARGMTLVEVMVAGAVLAFVLVGAMIVLIGVNNSSERIRRVGDAQTTARQSLQMLENELRAAGVGASQGTIAVGGTGGVYRMPTIYSEPDRVITTPGGASVSTSSVFIITADSNSVGISADGTGMMGAALGFHLNAGTPDAIIAQCSTAASAAVKCDDSASTPIITKLASGDYAPLIVTNDFRWAMMITPTTIVPDTDTNRSQVQFAEAAVPGLKPDPDQNFALAHILRARVTHWYVRLAADGVNYELARSFPAFKPGVLTGTSLLALAGYPTAGCDATVSPFSDETNGGTIKGEIMSSTPIDSLVVTYVTGAALNRADLPSAWSKRNAPIGICDSVAADTLREVRVELVARARTPDTNTPPKYSVPVIEGTPATGGAGDAYPRRIFSGRVVPRNALGNNAHLYPGS